MCKTVYGCMHLKYPLEYFIKRRGFSPGSGFDMSINVTKGDLRHQWTKQIVRRAAPRTLRLPRVPSISNSALSARLRASVVFVSRIAAASLPILSHYQTGSSGLQGHRSTLLHTVNSLSATGNSLAPVSTDKLPGGRRRTGVTALDSLYMPN